MELFIRQYSRFFDPFSPKLVADKVFYPVMFFAAIVTIIWGLVGSLRFGVELEQILMIYLLEQKRGWSETASAFAVDAGINEEEWTGPPIEAPQGLLYE